MSRSGYSDDCDGPELNLWRGAVSKAIRGARGQQFLREMIAALDAMPEKRLIESALVCDEGVCAMGAVAVARGLDTTDVDPFRRHQVAKLMGIAPALAAEIAFMNDDEFGDYSPHGSSPERRWSRMRTWAEEQLNSSLESKT